MIETLINVLKFLLNAGAWMIVGALIYDIVSSYDD